MCSNAYEFDRDNKSSMGNDIQNVYLTMPAESDIIGNKENIKPNVDSIVTNDSDSWSINIDLNERDMSNTRGDNEHINIDPSDMDIHICLSYDNKTGYHRSYTYVSVDGRTVVPVEDIAREIDERYEHPVLERQDAYYGEPKFEESLVLNLSNPKICAPAPESYMDIKELEEMMDDIYDKQADIVDIERIEKENPRQFHRYWFTHNPDDLYIGYRPTELEMEYGIQRSVFYIDHFIVCFHSPGLSRKV